MDCEQFGIHSASCSIYLNYSGPCILRPLVQPEKYGPKLEVVLKWRVIYVEHKSGVTVLKLRELLNRGVLNWRVYCTVVGKDNFHVTSVLCRNIIRKEALLFPLPAFLG